MAQREREASRHDTDDRVHPAVEADLAADDHAAVAGEAALPHVVADHQHERRPDALVVVDEIAPEQRRDPRDAESRAVISATLTGSASASPIRRLRSTVRNAPSSFTDSSSARHARKSCTTRRSSLFSSMSRFSSATIRSPSSSGSVGLMFARKNVKKPTLTAIPTAMPSPPTIVRAGYLIEHPQAENEIEPRASEPVESARVTNVLFEALYAAERYARATPSFVATQTLGPRDLVRFHLEVKPQLLVHIGLGSTAKENRAKTLARCPVQSREAFHAGLPFQASTQFTAAEARSHCSRSRASSAVPARVSR